MRAEKPAIYSQRERLAPTTPTIQGIFLFGTLKSDRKIGVISKEVKLHTIDFYSQQLSILSGSRDIIDVLYIISGDV